jgi:hypothetical protein
METTDVAQSLQALMDLALAHPEGPTVARAFDRTLQFDLVEGERFYLRAEGGRLTVETGESGLDWHHADWERVTCVRVSRPVLRDLIAGRRLISDAFFDRDVGFAPHRAADPQTGGTAIVTWLYTLFRLGQEQGARAARDAILTEQGFAAPS